MKNNLERISDKNPLESFSRGKILANIRFEGIEQDNNSNIVYIKRFNTSPPIKLISYVGDEFIRLENEYDVLIRKLVEKRRNGYDFLISLGEVYHSFSGGEELDIIVSGISNRGQPMFRLCDYIGFILPPYGIHIGDQLKIKIKKIKPAKKGEIIEATPLLFLGRSSF